MVPAAETKKRPSQDVLLRRGVVADSRREWDSKTGLKQKANSQRLKASFMAGRAGFEPAAELTPALT